MRPSVNPSPQSPSPPLWPNLNAVTTANSIEMEAEARTAEALYFQVHSAIQDLGQVLAVFDDGRSMGVRQH